MQKITMLQSASTKSAAESFQLFLRRCKVKNLSEKTLQDYTEHLKVFFCYYDESQPIALIRGQTVEDYIYWLQHESEHKYGAVSVNTHLRSLRAFLYYCMECGYIDRFKVHLIKAEKPIKETYTDEEIARLLRKPDLSSCGFSTYRTWVFVNYLLGTANRLSTALSVRIGDIDFQGGTILMRKTKNHKQQIIPLSSSLADVLVEYIEIRGGSGDDYLFCDQYGRQASLNSFQTAVRRYNLRRNVNKTSIHTFRHTFAKNWILAGGDVFRLQKILGHSSLTITKEYVNMFGQDLQLDFEKYNPLDRMTRQEERIKM